MVRPNGTTIRTVRKMQKLTLRELGQLADCHFSHLSRLERGKAGASDETLRRIAGALRVPVGAIATPTEETT